MVHSTQLLSVSCLLMKNFRSYGDIFFAVRSSLQKRNVYSSGATLCAKASIGPSIHRQILAGLIAVIITVNHDNLFKDRQMRIEIRQVSQLREQSAAGSDAICDVTAPSCLADTIVTSSLRTRWVSRFCGITINVAADLVYIATVSQNTCLISIRIWRLLRKYSWFTVVIIVLYMCFIDAYHDGRCSSQSLLLSLPMFRKPCGC